MHGRYHTQQQPNLEQLGEFDRLRLSWRLLRDHRVANWIKLLLPVIAAIYLISPIDLVPDMILGIGQIDDLGVIGFSLLLMTRLLPKLSPSWIVAEHFDHLCGHGSVVEATFAVNDPNPATTVTNRRGENRR
jgi:uncharacterized membrane protein YkvA (DUF1232 family)